MKRTLLLKTIFGLCFVMASFMNKAIAQTGTAAPTVQEAVSMGEMPETESNLETIKVTRRMSSVSRGYRVQIYSGPDREVAKATKISFMKRFPSIRSYISYEVPYYKIKVGDFKDRDDAKAFYRYLSKTYTTMVVPSLINNRIPPKQNKPKPQEVEETTTSPTDTAQ